MKAFLITLSLLAFNTLLGQDATTLSPYSAVSVGDGLKVEFEVGDDYSYRVSLTKGTMDPLSITSEKGICNIRQKGKGGFRGTITITAPSLSKISTYANGSFNSTQTISTEKLVIISSSNGQIVANVDVASLDVTSSSASNILLGGKSTSARLESSSASRIDAKGLDLVSCNTTASSGSFQFLTVSKSIIADASSGAKIRYSGSPSEVVVSKMGVTSDK